ncbi:molybdenum cofactor biosynthesis protein MoaE [Bowdeniella nasicola]|uniref:Molybdenum cofactor biosynthesis protein MoaE n=1 Tax=Bowdeniella nasicola TaxID=208480 RepID=A0A1Q5Q5A3_9ACTO|nr:molybdenum cofactor biosynthesis protein MoaE [Bowdeniella nasicola]OKL55007.1 molybdenum cofactor biosynthesis protein MoaE [Bowdeniella nasicola]
MSARVVTAEVTSDPIDVAALQHAVTRKEAGAILTFCGAVRNHDGGRAVDAIEYSGHPSADQIIRDVACDMADAFDVHALGVIHRIGKLGIGDDALVAVVAASHRAEAFACLIQLVDEVKARLPIWKLQKFSDGTDEWSNCP